MKTPRPKATSTYKAHIRRGRMAYAASVGVLCLAVTAACSSSANGGAGGSAASGSTGASSATANNGSASSSGTLTPITLQLALIPPKMIFIGFYVAQDEGFFARNGLKATLVPEPTGAQAIRAVEAGQGYFAVGGTDGVASADAAGGNLKALWDYGGDDLSIIANSKVKTISDLTNVKIGASDRVGPAYSLPVLAMRNAGIADPTKADFVILSGRPAMVGALASGQIDASTFHVDDGLTVVKKDPSLHIVADLAKAAPQWWYGTTSVSGSYAKSHPKVVEAFLTAMIEAQRWMYANPAPTIAIGVKYTKEDPDIVKESYNKLVADHLWNTDNAGLTKDTVDFTMQAYRNSGVIPKSSKIDYATIVDTHYIDNVLKKLGPSK